MYRFRLLFLLVVAALFALVGARWVHAPAPVVSSLSPTSVLKGSGAITLTVNGSNFISGCVVRWNGSARTTSFVSSAQVTASLSAADLSVAGNVPVSVRNPDAQISNSSTFTIRQPMVPHVNSLSPFSMVVGSPAFTLTVNGYNFAASSTVTWEGSPLTTHFISGTQLTAGVPATDLQTLGYFPIRVVNPGTDGGTSNLGPFGVVPAPVTIDIQDFGFSPRDVTVVLGQRVIFAHLQQNVPHTVTKDLANGPGPASPTLSYLQRFNYTVPLNVAHGTNIFYHCQFHGAAGNGTAFGEGMSGVVRVK